MLVKLATECWAALHPATPKPPKSKGKGKAKAPARVAKRGKTKKQPAIASEDEDDASEAASADLDALFRAMLVDDDALYARILRYEPLPFDELVSRAIAAGVSTKGWRPRLKRFLDMKVGLGRC